MENRVIGDLEILMHTMAVGPDEETAEEHDLALEYEIRLAELRVGLRYCGDEYLRDLFEEVLSMTKKIYSDSGVQTFWMAVGKSAPTEQ
jgi:hypothetical protein